MSVAIVLAIIVAALFAVIFFTKRRFGLLGLALAAGSIVSNLWSHDLTPLIRQAGLEIVSPPLSSIVAAALVLLPAAILLFSSPANKKSIHRIIDAAAFSVLAVAFLLPILGDALVLQEQGLEIYDMLIEYRAWIITAGISYAIVDLLLAKRKKEDTHKH